MNKACTSTTSCTASLAEQTRKHPCYSQEAHQQYARMHIPVAPACNIQCNYCNRKFDCVHESRPGVTSEILSPKQALEKYCWVTEKLDKVTVVGVAGPGDALANWPAVKKSLELIKREQPEVIFCLSTNGLMLPEYKEEILALGVHHVTVTCNAVDPAIGARLYRQVLYQGQRLTGTEAAATLLKNQLEGIDWLASQGVLVKVNIVMVKGINDIHIPEVVNKVKTLGAFMANIMPLIPAPGSLFEDFPQTSMKEVNDMRDLCQGDLPQMRHCRQCRADAIGLLGQDCSQEFRLTEQPCQSSLKPSVQQPVPLKIAVATKHGLLVDLHFGHASQFLIYEGDGQKFTLIEGRQVDRYCMGMVDCDAKEDRRQGILEALKDCDAVLTMRIGHQAKERLRQRGIRSFEFCDSVENGLGYAAKEMLRSKAI